MFANGPTLGVVANFETQIFTIIGEYVVDFVIQHVNCYKSLRNLPKVC